ncbi:MAG: hypothetical protein BWY54_00111 [Candidatus Dependentiae bacterium ADurb.Bin331]|nr:MAG: hypothetical protein BWY54_00111 [Candidatus Dependentiae bacterium ADurb.Bin331]
MNLLKLRKIGTSQNSYTSYYASSPELDLLGDFLEDFGYSLGLKLIKQVMNDPLIDSWAGNMMGFKKNEKGKFEIYNLILNDDIYFEIDQNVLLKIVESYIQLRQNHLSPKEIIITCDHNLQNPVVEPIY